jgi:amino acid adenylation domain-containing protein
VTGLARLFDDANAAHPERVAVESAEGDTITYRALDSRVTEFQEALRRVGVGPGDRVAIVAEKCIDSVAAILGILRFGAAYVPLDPTAPPARNAVILNDCEVAAVVASSGRVEVVRAALVEEAPAVRIGGPLHVGSLSVSPVTSPSPRLPSPGLAYILHTSGSTGRPKGVMVPHRAATSFVDWCSNTFAPVPTDRFASHAPFHFDLSIFDLFVSLGHGSALVLVDPVEGRLPDRLASFIAERRISVWYSTPTVLRWMARSGGLDRHAFAALRLALFAGEVFPADDLRTLKVAWSGARFFNLYGPTETNVCTWFEVPDEIPPDRGAPFPIGRACSHARVKVVEDRYEPGSPGELLVSGEGVMDGYWKRPDLTAEALRIDSDGVRWYRTGDLVTTNDDGDLVFVGRRDRMVKRRGYRIELGEIEIVLHRHAEVGDVAVLASADGDGGTTIDAFVRWTGVGKPSEIRLRRHCTDHLPGYMTPDGFHFVDALPSTSTHKVDYQQLAGMRR